MTGSFDVKDGKLVNVQYDEGEFDCNGRELTSLEGCPEKIDGSFFCFENKLKDLKGGPKEVEGKFDCSGNQLTSLEGCPEKIDGDFHCSYNQLTSLEGCPQKVGGGFNCSYNPNLEDISDLPPSCREIVIHACHKITKFSAKIDDTLRFVLPTEEVLKRIKKVPFYEVVEEGEDSRNDYAYYITVRQKRIGARLLDEL